MRILTLLAALAAASFCAVATGSTTAGPSPGVMLGSTGVSSPDGKLRYVTVVSAQETVVEKIAVPSGAILRSRWLEGAYGIPRVAYDGSVGGLSRDGRTLVLAPNNYGRATESRFPVIDTTTMKVRSTISVPGTFSLDALSPDARTVYLIQYLFPANGIEYRVRAYDLGAGRLLKRVIADKRDRGEPMTGLPMARVTGPGGGWVYTLYTRPGMPFIHALDAAHRGAVCIDLPWSGSDQELSAMRLRLRDGGGTLVVGRPGGPAAIVVDTKTFRARKA